MADGQKILVTGAAGYLGAVLCEHLLNAGHAVTAVDSFAHGIPSLAHLCANPAFAVIRADVRDTDVMKPLYTRHDTIIPLAALVGAPLCDRDPQAALAVNQTAIETMLTLLGQDQRVLMPITNSGYGIGAQDGYCTEESPLNPISLYGRTKVEAEAAVLARGNAISFRLATVFGMSPRMRLDLLVNDFVHRAVTDRSIVLFEAHFRRNYIHVRDVARAFLHGLVNFDQLRDNVFNVGLSDANLTKRELCEKIKEQVPALQILEAPVGEDPDKRDYLVSNAKIEATGYAPAFSLEKGIAELIMGYRMISAKRFTNV